MKKIIILLTTILMACSLLACKQSTDPKELAKINAEYQEFVNEIPSMIFEGDETIINQLFADPSAIGINPQVANWDSYSIAEAEKMTEITEEIKKENESYQYDDLDDKNKVTYDFIEYITSDGINEIPLANNYYLANNVLGAYEGVVSNVFITLYFYNLRNENDVKSYINLMNTLSDFQAELLSFEQERQDNGYGMTPSEIELAIANLDDSLQKADFAFMVDDFVAKIETLDLDDNTKTEYIAEVKTNLENNLHSFYQGIRDGLMVLDVKQADGTVLADLEYGKEYFENLVYDYSGFKKVDEYEDYVLDKYETVIGDVLSLLGQYDASELDSIMYGNFTFSDQNNPNDVLNYLKEAISEDFPSISDVPYNMVELPEQFGVLMPGVGAFYLTGTLDDKDATQQMMLNGTYSQSDFLTIAHEGFPGHMYQNIYMTDIELPYIYSLFGNIGYTEGYANYVQRLSAKYAADPSAAEIYELNDTLTYIVILELDTQLNYYGEDISDDVEEMFGLTGSDAEGLIEQLQFMPGGFICYYGSGLQFDDLYAKVISADASVTLKDFHTSILNAGPLPIDLLKEVVYQQYGIGD